MDRIVLDTSQIVGTRESNDGVYQVCTRACAEYSEVDQHLTIKLDAFVRRVEIRGKDEVSRPVWLPRPESVCVSVSLQEAPEAAREIFRDWSSRVRKAMPLQPEWPRPACSSGAGELQCTCACS